MGAWSRLSFGSTLTAHDLDRLPSAWSQGPEGSCVYGSVVADLGLNRRNRKFVDARSKALAYKDDLRRFRKQTILIPLLVRSCKLLFPINQHHRFAYISQDIQCWL